jgi:hypothetical protein
MSKTYIPNCLSTREEALGDGVGFCSTMRQIYPAGMTLFLYSPYANLGLTLFDFPLL